MVLLELEDRGLHSQDIVFIIVADVHPFLFVDFVNQTGHYIAGLESKDLPVTFYFVKFLTKSFTLSTSYCSFVLYYAVSSCSSITDFIVSPLLTKSKLAYACTLASAFRFVSIDVASSPGLAIECTT